MSSLIKTLFGPVCLIATLATSLHATSFSTIYSFGDSLSDAGNIYTGTGGAIPTAPYVNGEFSNGPVWVQDLSTSLGLGSATASLQGGHDFAYGDAQTGTTPVHTATQIDLTGATGQIAQFQALHPIADPNALYTIWIGSNDLESILTSGATPAAAATDVAAVIANIDSAIGTLAGEGAKNFLVLTVPDLGKTPAVSALGPAAAAAASQLSAGFDQALAGSLPAVPGINISLLNTYSLLDGVIANSSAYGFTDVTDPCYNSAANTLCSTTLAGQNQYLFWDTQHPTAAGQALVGEGALSVVTPEPATFALLGAGLFAVYFQRRRRA